MHNCKNFKPEQFKEIEPFLTELTFEPAVQKELSNYGSAIKSCVESEEGVLVVHNYEYISQVNFCPYCGYKAKVQMERIDAPLT